MKANADADGVARFVEPLRQQGTPTLIASELRSLIASGRVQAGERLNETLLSQEFGVSRGPLREAIQLLAQEGLVRRERNRGTFVRELNVEDIKDLYLARSAIEQAAAERILRAGEYEPASRRLRDAVDRLLIYQQRLDPAGYREADMAFHLLLVELSGSPRLMRIQHTLVIETQMYMVLETRGRLSNYAAEIHVTIVDAIARDDASATREAIARHMAHGLDELET